MRRKPTLILILLAAALALAALWTSGLAPAAAQEDLCTGEFIPVSPALTDLGAAEYVRLQSGPTGLIGGLYPGGQNEPPAAHAAAGREQAAQIVPRDPQGNPDPDGQIVLISVGMSNTASEFGSFERDRRGDNTVNPQLVIVNGAQGGRTAEFWVDPEGEPWQFIDDLIVFKGATPEQVGAAWIKLTNFQLEPFPQATRQLQADLEQIARNLHSRYPNLKIAYFSSRTRAYAYFEGANPEPGAFETGFAVRWLIEKQIDGDPALNYDPQAGPVVAPYLLWGPYLWADGLNPRSDGLVWTQQDLKGDCVHPTEDGGRVKVAAMLDDFFRTHETARGWFLADPGAAPSPTPGPSPTPTATPGPDPTPRPTYVPLIFKFNGRVYIAR